MGRHDDLTAALRVAEPVRVQVRVRGQVQGVGFRPFVYRLAHELALGGSVCNDGDGVAIELQGVPDAVAAFLDRLQSEAPPLARVHSVACDPLPVTAAADRFVIAGSQGGRSATAITPDTAVCPDCLTELFAPSDRRYRYPLINCTNCGPRYTITRALPYDRPNTSMAGFTMCPQCQSEYDDPLDRRFHAQPTACARCGPPIALFGRDRRRVNGDPCAATAARIKRGQIVAIKGLGGFHLVCDARNARAVAALRQRKQREEKPFAVMVASLASLPLLADVTEHEARLLAARERPIVLLRKRRGCDELLPGVAPGLAWLGVMLPYTPLHYLLFHEAAGRPRGAAWLEAPHALTLVMTSANPHDEPLVKDNEEAFARLGGIADAFLMHDRDIVIRCDDSVARSVDAGWHPASGAPALQLTRRARGYTPQAIRLDRAYPSALALGPMLKNTVCVIRGDEAFLSQHLGDLDNRATCDAFEHTVDHLLHVLEVKPAIVARDLHPDFQSSAHAARLAAERGIPCLAVQHHHAHIAAIVAEHRIDGPVLGLALDGVGLGADGGIWGGELMRVAGTHFQRLGHLSELKLPGGDSAARAALAHGRGGAARDRPRRRDRAAFSRVPGRGGARDAGERRAQPPNLQHGTLVRRRRGAVRDQAQGRVRGAGGDAAGRARRTARPRCTLARCHRNHVGPTARSAAALLSSHRHPRPGPRRGGVPRHAGGGARGMVGTRGARARPFPGRAGRRLFPEPRVEPIGARTARSPRPRGARGAPRPAQRRRRGPRSGVGRGTGEPGGTSGMCLAIPVRVVALMSGDQAIVDAGGVRKEISLALVEGVGVGDYVILHVGYALQKLDEDEARRTLELFAEMGGIALDAATP